MILRTKLDLLLPLKIDVVDLCTTEFKEGTRRIEQNNPARFDSTPDDKSMVFRPLHEMKALRTFLTSHFSSANASEIRFK